MSPSEIVLALFNALASRDFDEALTFVGTDILYHNIPMAPLRGKERFQKFLRPWTDSNDEIQVFVHNLVSVGDQVIVERTDRDRHTDKSWVSTRAAAFMVVSDGKIQIWRDYYDLNSFCLQNGRSYEEIVNYAAEVSIS